MKHTVQEFLLHHDLLGVQIFHIMEKGLFIVQMIKSKANNVCMRGQDNWWMITPEIQVFVYTKLGVTYGHELQTYTQLFDILFYQASSFKL